MTFWWLIMAYERWWLPVRSAVIRHALSPASPFYVVGCTNTACCTMPDVRVPSTRTWLEWLP